MRAYLLLTGLAISSCGSDRLDTTFTTPPEHLRPQIDKDLQPILDQFLVDASDYSLGVGHLAEMQKLVFTNPEVSARWESDSHGTLGLCQYYGESATAKSDSKVWWNVYIKDMPSSCVRDLVVYHELAHCIYRVDHSSSTESVMYPYLNTSEETCQFTWNDKIATLFKTISKR
jgi:hypothetical protein